MLIEEVLENEFKGSIYHPKLLEFELGLENGLDQHRETVSEDSSKDFQNRRTNRYHFLSTVLSEKPYAFSLYADQTWETNNFDFFERQTIEGRRIGGNFGYQNDWVPVHLLLSEGSKTIRRSSRPSQQNEDRQINLSLNHTGDWTGDSTLDLSRDDFERVEYGYPEDMGATSLVSAGNQSKLFGKEDLVLSSTLRSNQLNGTSENRQLEIGERLDVEHSETFNSSYNYDFSNNVSEQTDTRNNRWNAFFRHRLYESLYSSLNLNYFTDRSASVSQDRAGLLWNEDYIKKIGPSTRLSLGGGLGYETEERRTSQDVIHVAQEAQTLVLGSVTLLELPNVDLGTVTVTDTTGTITYLENADYQLSASGARTQIQRLGGGNIADGQTVWVEYDAAASPLFAFNTVSNNYRTRLDFFDDRLGIFYRYSQIRHPEVEGEENAILESITEETYGFDFRVWIFAVEWENQDYNSSLSPYLRQQWKGLMRLNPTARSTYTLQTSASQVEILEPSSEQKYYDIINRFNLLVSSRTRLELEGGYRAQRGPETEVDDWVFRSALETRWGRLDLSAEYEYENRTTLGENTTNHFVMTKAKRTF